MNQQKFQFICLKDPCGICLGSLILSASKSKKPFLWEDPMADAKPDDKKAEKKVKRPSALKNDLQNERRRTSNRSYRATVNTAIRNFQNSLDQMCQQARHFIWPCRHYSNFITWLFWWWRCWCSYITWLWWWPKPRKRVCHSANVFQKFMRPFVWWRRWVC